MANTVAGTHLTGDHASRPAANTVPDGTLYSCTDHSLIYLSNYAGNSWSTWANLTGTGIAASLADAAGDTLVASGADAWAKLAIGNAGANLARVNGAVAWNANTSFPTAATGDRFYRTDHGREYFYDGTRWLSTTMYFAHGNAITITATSNESIRYCASADSDIYIVNWDLVLGVFGTNNGSNFWVLEISRRATNDTGTQVTPTVSTAALAASTWHSISTSVGVVITRSTNPTLLIQAVTKTGTPANIQIHGGFSYRLIAT